MDYKPSVLVVDDEKTLCNLICLELEEEGYICDSTTRAKNALKKIKKHKYDLVLLDIRLPEMSGIDLLKEIKKCHPEMIIIMLTAVNDLDTAVEVIKLGASDYIVKPFTHNRLLASISAVLYNCTHNRVFYHKHPISAYDDSLEKSEESIFQIINNIARGVDAQVNNFDHHSKLVIKKTADITRRLNLPEKIIEEWVVANKELESAKVREFKEIARET